MYLGSKQLQEISIFSSFAVIGGGTEEEPEAPQTPPGG